MNTPWDVLASKITRLGDRIDAQPVVREATVYVANPLAVRFDTDTANTTVQGSLAGGLGVGERVLTIKLRHYVWVLGRKGGVTPWSTVGGIPGWLTGGTFTPDLVDLNDAIQTGLHRSGPGALNQPPTANEYWSTRVENTGLRSIQWCTPWTSFEMWRRHRNLPGDGSFTPWQLIDRPRTSWVPTSVNGLTIGNGTFSCSYWVASGVVYGVFQFQLGSTSAVTGDIQVPVPWGSGAVALSAGFPGRAYDASSQVQYSTTVLTNSQHIIIRPNYTVAGDALIRVTSFGPSTPMSWASGDVIAVGFTYPLT